MEAITSLVTAPLDAISSLVPTSIMTPATAPFDDDTLRMLVYNLFQGDSRLQQQMLEQHYDEHVKFCDGLIHLEGREALGQLLHGFQLLADAKPDVIEISISPDRALVLLNLRVAWRLLPWTYWRRLGVPLLIKLHFRTGLTGAGIITSHEHCLSHLGLLWMGQNPLADWFVQRMWAPYSGVLLSLAAAATEQTVSRYSAEVSRGASRSQAFVNTLLSLAGMIKQRAGSVQMAPIPSKASSRAGGQTRAAAAAGQEVQAPAGPATAAKGQ